MSRTPYVTPHALSRALTAKPDTPQYVKAADKGSLFVSTSLQEVMRATVAQPISGKLLVTLTGYLQSYSPNLQCIWQLGLATVGGGYISGSTQSPRLIDRFLESSQQSVTITGAPTGGTFTLTLTSPTGTAQTTAAIPFNATTATVASALAALPLVASTSNVVVNGATGGPYAVSFLNTAIDSIGRPPTITATSSLTGGTTPAVTVGGSSAVPPRFLHSGWRTVPHLLVDLSSLGNPPGTQCDILWNVTGNIASAGQMDFAAAGGTGASMLLQPL